jgi:hypothetical protein
MSTDSHVSASASSPRRGALDVASLLAAVTLLMAMAVLARTAPPADRYPVGHPAPHPAPAPAAVPG